MIKKLLQLLIAGLLVAPTATPVTDAKEEFHYLSLGASQTAGFGLDGFLPEEFYIDETLMYGGTSGSSMSRAFLYSTGYYFQPETSYPNQVGKALKDYFESQGNTTTKVVVGHAEMSGTRARDLDYWLHPDKPKDGYYESKSMPLGGWFTRINEKGTSQSPNGKDVFTVNGEEHEHEIPAMEGGIYGEMTRKIEKADLITYDYGVNDFGAFLLGVAYGFDMFKPDLSLISPELAEVYDNCKTALKDILNQYGGDLLAPIQKNLDMMVDSLSYGLAGFIDSFDSTMDAIYTINPDVDVIVVEIQNIYEGLHLNFNSLDIDVGKLFGAVIKAANLYTAYVSPYAAKYLYADIDGKDHTQYFIDQFDTWGSTLNPESETYYTDLVGEINTDFVEFIHAIDIYNLMGSDKNATGKIDRAQSQIKGELYTKYFLSQYDDSITNYDTAIAWMRDSARVGVYGELANAIEIERKNKCNIVYFALTKAMSIAAKNRSISFENLGFMSKASGSAAYEAVANIAVKYRDNWTASLDMEDVFASMDDEITTLMGTTIPGTDSTYGNAMVMNIYNGMFACSFFVHPNQAGHDEMTEIIMDTYKNNKSVKADGLLQIKNIIDTFPDLTRDVIRKIAHEDQTQIDTTRAQADAFIDLIKGYIDVITPFFTDAKAVVEKIGAFLDENGVIAAISNEIDSFLKPIKERLEADIADIEVIIASVQDMGSMTLDALREVAPSVAAMIDRMYETINFVSEKIPAFVEAFDANMGIWYADYESGKYNSVNFVIESIINLKKVSEVIGAFTEKALNRLNNFVRTTDDIIISAARNAVDAAVWATRKFLSSREYGEIVKAIAEIKEMSIGFAKFLDYADPFLGHAKAVIACIDNAIEHHVATDVLPAIRARIAKTVESVEFVMASVGAAAASGAALVGSAIANTSLTDIKNIVLTTKALMEASIIDVEEILKAIKGTGEFIADVLPPIIENTMSVIEKAGFVAGAFTIEAVKDAVILVDMTYAAYKYSEYCVGEIYEFNCKVNMVLNYLRRVVNNVIDFKNAVRNRIEDIVESVINSVVNGAKAAYNSLPAEFRRIVEQAVTNVINLADSDFELLRSQITALVDHTITVGSEEFREIVFKIDAFEKKLQNMIGVAVADAVNSVVDAANQIEIIISTNEDTVIYTVRNCVTTNTVNLVVSVEEGIDSIITQILDEIFTDLEIDFVQQADKVAEAYNEVKEVREEGYNATLDALDHAEESLADAIASLLRTWHLR